MNIVENTSQGLYTFFDCLPEFVAWNTGYTLTNFGLKLVEDGWLLTVKVKAKGSYLIAFAGAPTIREACVLFYKFLVSRASTGIKWRLAKW